MKSIRYIFEYIFLRIFSFICILLPSKTASDFGGFLGKTFGPIIGDQNSAKSRIRTSLKTESVDKIYKQSWENLGRTLAEYPRLEEISKTRVTIENLEILENALKSGAPVLCVSAHIGNWELMPVCAYTHLGATFSSLYREPNNPYTAKILEEMRSIGGALNGIPKSKAGAIELIRRMKNKENIGFLFDQKYNEGDPIPLFNREAMSYTSFIPLCQKYGYVIIPGRIERLDDYRFIQRFENPIALQDKKGLDRSKEDVFLELNKLLESWIEKTPGQWLWQHKRWGKEEEQ